MSRHGLNPALIKTDHVHKSFEMATDKGTDSLTTIESGRFLNVAAGIPMLNVLAAEIRVGNALQPVCAALF